MVVLLIHPSTIMRMLTFLSLSHPEMQKTTFPIIFEYWKSCFFTIFKTGRISSQVFCFKFVLLFKKINFFWRGGGLNLMTDIWADTLCRKNSQLRLNEPEQTFGYVQNAVRNGRRETHPVIFLEINVVLERNTKLILQGALYYKRYSRYSTTC